MRGSNSRQGVQHEGEGGWQGGIREGRGAGWAVQGEKEGRGALG